MSALLIFNSPFLHSDLMPCFCFNNAVRRLASPAVLDQPCSVLFRSVTLVEILSGVFVIPADYAHSMICFFIIICIMRPGFIVHVMCLAFPRGRLIRADTHVYCMTLHELTFYSSCSCFADTLPLFFFISLRKLRQQVAVLQSPFPVQHPVSVTIFVHHRD